MKTVKTTAEHYFMRAALEEAKKICGMTGTNPAVGCVLTADDKIAARGAHRGPGTPHAEIAAIRNLSIFPSGGVTMYVNLEPCSHFGRTPPCAQAIVRSGIKKVVVGCEDKNPEVRGKGIKYLKSNGVHVRCGVLEEECMELNEPFFKFAQTGGPFITHKIAMTVDGKIALHHKSGGNKNITSFASRKYVHELRLRHDAVLTGVGTVIADNPELTIRHVKKPQEKKLYRVILDSQLRIPVSANVLKNVKDYPVIVATTRKAPVKKMQHLEKMGAEVVVFSESRDGVDLKEVFKYLGKRDIVSVLVEGGVKLNTTLFKEKLADKLMIFIAPVLSGARNTVPVSREMPDLQNAMKDIVITKSGQDILVEGRTAN